MFVKGDVDWADVQVVWRVRLMVYPSAFVTNLSAIYIWLGGLGSERDCCVYEVRENGGLE